MITNLSIQGKFPIKTLGDVAEFLDSRRRPITASDRVSGPYPYYGANGQQDSVVGYIFDEPLILLAEDGGLFDQPDRGIAYAIEGKTWVNNHAHVIRPKSNTSLRYLLRVLENYDVTPWITGSTRAKLTKAGASGIQIPLPPLAEQKRIAAILDAADALRTKRREALAQLDALLQSTFLTLFGDPAENPMGWLKRSVGEAISDGFIHEIQDGNHGEKHPKVADFTDEGIPFIMANCMQEGRLNLDNAYRLSSDWKKRLRVGFSKPGDALLSHKGTVGEVAIVPSDIDLVILSPQVTYYRTSEKLIAIFLTSQFASPGFQHLLAKEAKQSTRAYIGITRQKSLSIIIPPLPLQQKFAAIVESIERQKTAQRAHLTELDALFAALQHRAFRGEL